MFLNCSVWLSEDDQQIGSLIIRFHNVFWSRSLSPTPQFIFQLFVIMAVHNIMIFYEWGRMICYSSSGQYMSTVVCVCETSGSRSCGLGGFDSHPWYGSVRGSIGFSGVEWAKEASMCTRTAFGHTREIAETNATSAVDHTRDFNGLDNLLRTL